MDKEDLLSLYNTRYSQHKQFFLTNILANRYVCKKLSLAQRGVLLTIINYVDWSNGILYATYKMIKKETGISKPTMVTTIKKLVKLSIVKHQGSMIMFNPRVYLKGRTGKKIALEKLYKNFDRSDK